MMSAQERKWAVEGARVEYGRLRQAMTRLLELFPELSDGAAQAAKPALRAKAAAVSQTPQRRSVIKTPAQRALARGTMSRKQRKQISIRMKKYWAERRQQREEHEREMFVQVGEQGQFSGA